MASPPTSTTTVTTTTTTDSPNEQQQDHSRKIKPNLTGSQATSLIALYARHLEATQPDPSRRLLNDTYATQTISKLDYPFAELHVGGGTVTYVGLRGTQLDNWTRDFVSRHPTCTVVNMACGLDSRALRLDCGYSAFTCTTTTSTTENSTSSSSSGSGGGGGGGNNPRSRKIRWIDVDLPDVVELRDKVIPRPKRRPQPDADTGEEEDYDYTLLAGSAASPEFIRTLPNDRPTIIVCEGLSAYLAPEEGREMIKTICSHFGGSGTKKCRKGVDEENEIVFEAINWFTLALQGLLGYLKRTNSAVSWGIDDCKELEKLHEGLVLVEEHPVCMLPGVENSPLAGRIFWWCASWFSFSRNSLRHVRYKF